MQYLKTQILFRKEFIPVYLYYKEQNKLVLAYGISETEPPIENWIFNNKKESISDWHIKEFGSKPDRYGASLIKAIYNTDKELDSDLMQKDLNELLVEYSKYSFESDLQKIPSKIQTKGTWKFTSIFLDEIINKNNLKKGDQRLVFSLRKNRLNMDYWPTV